MMGYSQPLDKWKKIQITEKKISLLDIYNKS